MKDNKEKVGAQISLLENVFMRSHEVHSPIPLANFLGAQTSFKLRSFQFFSRNEPFWEKVALRKLFRLKFSIKWYPIWRMFGESGFKWIAYNVARNSRNLDNRRFSIFSHNMPYSGNTQKVNVLASKSPWDDVKKFPTAGIPDLLPLPYKIHKVRNVHEYNNALHN